MVSNGEESQYIGSIEDTLLQQLFDLRVSRQEVSLDRSEDRDKSNTLILNLPTDSEQLIMSSYVGGTYIQFSVDFTEVWVNDGVKPTLSYEVAEPTEAKTIFEQIVGDVSISNFGGADDPDNVTVDSSKKPPTLTVSCGDIGVNAWLGTYSWLYKNLEDGTAQSIDADSSHPLTMLDSVPTLSIVPSTLSHVEPRLAVLQFANVPDKIKVTCYAIDEKDTDKGEVISVKDMAFQMKEGKHLYEIIAEWTDAKENSGKAYYAFQTIMPDLEIVDMNTVETNIFAGTIRDTYLYSDNKLTKIALGIPKGTKVYVVETDTPNGSAKVVYGEYMGWTPSINLQLGEVSNETVEFTSAIASVLNEKYRAEKPDGLLHNETASGTPLKGNSGHMEEATVYLLVYHMKYSVNGGQLEEVEGGFVPTAISFKIDENGQYTLKEYWTPRTGANYEKDVLGKFPGASATDVLNTEQYAEDLIKGNWRLASEALSKIKS